MTTPTPTPAKAGGLDIYSLLTQILGLQSVLKKGVKTSEFALAVVGIVSTILLQLFGKDWGLAAHGSDIASLALTIIPAAYALARSYTKASHDKVIMAAINAGVYNVTNVPTPAPPAPPAPVTPSADPVPPAAPALVARPRGGRGKLSG